jgi:hypothetical protein
MCACVYVCVGGPSSHACSNKALLFFRLLRESVVRMCLCAEAVYGMKEHDDVISCSHALFLVNALVDASAVGEKASPLCLHEYIACTWLAQALVQHATLREETR